MKDYYEFDTEGDPYISSVDGQPKYSMLDFRPWIKHEVPQTTPLYNEGGTYNLDRLGQLINRFSDGKHPEMVASLQRQLDAETARINQGYQNARNDFAQVGASLPQAYDLAGDYKHAQAMNAINYDKIRRNQASAPRQAGYYSSTLPRLPEYDAMNRDAMAYQEEQKRIAAERERQLAAERAYLEEQARKDAERKAAEEAKRKAYADDYGFDYGAQSEGQSSMWGKSAVNTAPTNVYTSEDDPEFRSGGFISPENKVEKPLVTRPAEASGKTLSSQEKLEVFDKVFGSLSENPSEAELRNAMAALQAEKLTATDAANLRYYDAWKELQGAIDDIDQENMLQSKREEVAKKLGQQPVPKKTVISKAVKKGRFART